MSAEQNQTPQNETHTDETLPKDVSTNPDLGIKKVRTFADDLREAKEKAGVVDDGPAPKKKKGLFGRAKKDKALDKKTLSETRQPHVEAQIQGSAPTPPPQRDSEPAPQAKQPSKEYIEQELARSGIVTSAQVKRQSGEPEVQNDSGTGVPAIRTYKYDAAETAETQKASQVSILAAEQRRRSKNKDFSSLQSSGGSAGRNIALIVISLLLVGSGTFGIIFFYNQSRIDTEGVVRPNSGTVLFTNSEREVIPGNIRGAEFISFLDTQKNNVDTSVNDIAEITLLENSVLGTRVMAAETFLGNIDGAPDRLARAVRDEFLFGVHGNRNTPVFIFKTNDFDATFASMLEWERSMSRDLAPLFGPQVSGTFADVIIRNKDTRLLRDRSGNTVLLYTFPNTETVLITTNETTYFEVFERLTASNATRN